MPYPPGTHQAGAILLPFSQCQSQPKIKPARCTGTQGVYQQGSKNFSLSWANLSKAEKQAIKDLKRDKSRIVFTADKGVIMLVMDRQEYIDESNYLLPQPAYRLTPRDPTNKIKIYYHTQEDQKGNRLR